MCTRIIVAIQAILHDACHEDLGVHGPECETDRERARDRLRVGRHSSGSSSNCSNSSRPKVLMVTVNTLTMLATTMARVTMFRRRAMAVTVYRRCGGFCKIGWDCHVDFKWTCSAEIGPKRNQETLHHYLARFFRGSACLPGPKMGSSWVILACCGHSSR